MCRSVESMIPQEPLGAAESVDSRSGGTEPLNTLSATSGSEEAEPLKTSSETAEKERSIASENVEPPASSDGPLESLEPTHSFPDRQKPLTRSCSVQPRDSVDAAADRHSAGVAERSQKIRSDSADAAGCSSLPVDFDQLTQKFEQLKNKALYPSLETEQT